MGGTSLHKFQQLSTDTAVSIEKTARTLQRLQSQLDSLAAMVLQNRQALDLLTAKFISSRLQQFQTKLLLLQGWKLVSDVEHPNLDQVERDFCSARQAYTHAQQVEVTEERPLLQFSRSILSTKSLRGELLGEAH